MNTYLITLIMLTITITGCGSKEEKKTIKETVVTNSSVNNPAKEAIKTSDLISTPDFNFISSTNLEVVLPASPSTTVSYFISICTDFSKENDEVIINYDSCKLRTTLTSSEQTFTLSLSTVEVELIAQIWPIEEDAQPINVHWNIAEFGNSWQISI